MASLSVPHVSAPQPSLAQPSLLQYSSAHPHVASVHYPVPTAQTPFPQLPTAQAIPSQTYGSILPLSPEELRVKYVMALTTVIGLKIIARCTFQNSTHTGLLLTNCPARYRFCP